ncbi:glycosyltransferase family 1 protein [Pseudidiomarina aquimaris]|uniref:Glycosyltransferase family 1 protein n=1 Tax=Pseudidiomarina aquimaris TaxID=641841 RepID=A0A432XCZ0_9GAMM|nr:glycosyltransferase family 4 protein [Pseudidiomarina aquimaris]RUO46619.1 glycosyltransferase family 1 protein [Pseudidiomarina aquimaris]
MRIVLVASLAESLTNFRGELIQSFIDVGIEVHVAAPSLSPGASVRQTLEKKGVVCHNIAMQRNGLNPLCDIRTCYQLYRLVKLHKIDIFFGYTAKPVIWGVVASYYAGVSSRVALITGLGYAFTGKARGLRGVIQKIAKSLYKYSLRKASLVFFQNPDDLEEFTTNGLLPRDIRTKVVNGSGVDTGNFAKAPLPSKATINYLLIARLLGDKGIREYVAAAREISNRYPETQFHLVGGLDTNPNGISEGEVKSWLQQGIVQWRGAVSDVRPFISDSHVYVLPSYREGTPRSVLEAMSMGRAIITTDAPGCRETVVDGDNGFLVDVQSVEQLITAMERFIQQPELIDSMGQRSREIACEKYDVHRVNDEMLKAMGIIKG